MYPVYCLTVNRACMRITSFVLIGSYYSKIKEF